MCSLLSHVIFPRPFYPLCGQSGHTHTHLYLFLHQSIHWQPWIHANTPISHTHTHTPLPVFINLYTDNHEFIPIPPFQSDIAGFILFSSLPFYFYLPFLTMKNPSPIILNICTYLANPSVCNPPPVAVPSPPPRHIFFPPASDADILCRVTPSPHGHLLILLGLQLGPGPLWPPHPCPSHCTDAYLFSPSWWL